MMDDDDDDFDWVPVFEKRGEAPRVYRGARLIAWDPRYGAIYRLPKGDGPEYGGHADIGEKDLSEDQVRAVEKVMSWHQEVAGTFFGGDALSLGGYAGTGKTTVISVLARKIGAHKIAFVAFTGKASAVLRRKLRAARITPGYCGTIHSCIYMPEVDELTGRVVGWELREWSQLYHDTELIICDEASMVDTQLWADLRSYLIPVLAVGDPGQLPPVGKDCESPVADPNILLDRIHRQSDGNPVIEYATRVRNDTGWERFTSEDPRFKRVRRGADRDFVWDFYSENREGSWMDRVLLCHYNKTRVGINASVREAVGYAGIPRDGDVVTVLKNLRIESTKIFNGMRGEVAQDAVELGDDHFIVVARFEDDEILVVAKASRHQFGHERTFQSYEDAEQAGHQEVRNWRDMGVLMDYAYALTVHKSQGSQYSDVGLFLEGSSRDTRRDHLRWVYTGATRAAERLTVVG